MTRILTYNVHRCVGVDRRLDVGRIADVVAALEPDIVALQELDVGRARTGGVDQAHEIARRLEMAFHFHPAMSVEEELYGDAILTRLPERLVRADALPPYPIRGLEPRGALWIEVDLGEDRLQVINTHLGLVPQEQRRQARALAGRDWVGDHRRVGPTVLLGDFNAVAGSAVHRILTADLADARRVAPARAPTPTFPSTFPLVQIDHVFVSPEVEVRALFAPYTQATRKASDHLPLVMDFEVRRQGPADAAAAAS
ncbi:endonuclease [Caulobacter sp. CCUG 60055]|uniref:endonuclease/exonuclease/phosphatase family protein n=1 Tax=Caulobacter sp. CCUG 60055 TaxID=2100090 RepID=UPI001FA818BD|nr:endonuclease/exonuclease/phosphatase family protein [Caulobacter sp. CCUG 60055]MBQ1540813.1 endonuclease/exonuclease/phosphatase family protein [Caulobacteraceae bacterium]MCI3179317.1 endonuclease [Caulobacter sp. CCUG 60055]